MKDKEIIELYENGYSTSEIREKIGCSTGTIYNALKRNKKPTRNFKHGINVEIRNDIKDKYLSNMSVNEISNITGICPQKINEILDDFNITRISSSKRCNPGLIEDFFENIDSSVKAYWLGWMLTDGMIWENSISISLKSCDEDILKLLEHDLGLVDKVKPFNKNYRRFYFCCKKMVDDLSRFGVVKNKTFSVKLPDVNEEYIPGLLRGCFDGDGGISVLNSRGKTELEFSFCGTNEAVSKFNELISKYCNIPLKHVTRNNSIFRVRWSNRNEILKIFEYLYKDCGEHRLERKYQKYLKILELENEVR